MAMLELLGPGRMRVLPSGIDVIDDGSEPVERPSVGELHGTETILVVEDEPMMREVLGAALHGFGYTVVPAGDGEEAIDAAAKYGGPIHLVLADVVMPRVDGATLVSELRRWYPGIGILLMSGMYHGATVALELRDDRAFFIRKPFTINALAVAVRSAIDDRPHGAFRDPG